MAGMPARCLHSQGMWSPLAVRSDSPHHSIPEGPSPLLQGTSAFRKLPPSRTANFPMPPLDPGALNVSTTHRVQVSLTRTPAGWRAFPGCNALPGWRKLLLLLWLCPPGPKYLGHSAPRGRRI